MSPNKPAWCFQISTYGGQCYLKMADNTRCFNTQEYQKQCWIYYIPQIQHSAMNNIYPHIKHAQEKLAQHAENKYLALRATMLACKRMHDWREQYVRKYSIQYLSKNNLKPYTQTMKT